MCCCLSPADATHGWSPHLIWFLFQGWTLWTGTNFTACKSCGGFRLWTWTWTWWEKRGICTSKVEEQQKQSSLEEGKLRQIGCSEIKILANLGGQWPWAERGKGWGDILNGKDAVQGIFLSYASTPVFSGTSMPGWPWSTGLWVSSSCTPGVSMAAKKVVGEWQNTGRGKGFGMWEDALEEVEGLWNWGGKKNCSFKIIWGLTSGAHWGTCSVGGSPCIITKKPE